VKDETISEITAEKYQKLKKIYWNTDITNNPTAKTEHTQECDDTVKKSHIQHTLYW